MVVFLAPAGAKKKGPKPWTSPKVSILSPHPPLCVTSCVTAQEFQQTCAVPTSNGFDAAVFEVPNEYRAITSAVKAVGRSGNRLLGHDIDMYLFDESCILTTSYADAAPDTVEVGTLPVGTAFVLVHNFGTDTMVDVHVELKPVR